MTIRKWDHQQKIYNINVQKGTCILGYNNYDFFYKIKSQDPLMDAKLNSRRHS